MPLACSGRHITTVCIERLSPMCDSCGHAGAVAGMAQAVLAEANAMAGYSRTPGLSYAVRLCHHLDAETQLPHGSSQDADTGLCHIASLVATAARMVTTRAGGTRGDLAAASGFPRALPRIAEPRHGRATGNSAQRPVAPAQRAAARGRLRSAVAGEGSGGTRPCAGARGAQLHADAAGAVSGRRG